MNKTCFFLIENNGNNNNNNTESIFITNIITCILNFLFSLTTCVGNFFILFAIRKTSDLHKPSFILLGCLAASDLLVGLICQPIFVAYKIVELVENFSAHCTLRIILSISSWIAAGVSLATLAAVSIDRLLALTLHLRYNMIVTVRRVFQTDIVLWALSITVAVLRFWMGTEWHFIPVAIYVLTFLVTTLSTFLIFQGVRKHQRQINDQNVAVSHLQSNKINALKCKKSAVTVLYVYGLFSVFYLPHFLTLIMDNVFGYTTTVKIAYDYAITAVFINSFLNPLVYCWRIGEIRQAVKKILRRQWQNL